MGRSAKAELLRISFAVSGWVETTKRAIPTEKAMSFVAWRDEESFARTRWAAVPERAKTMPGGPGTETRTLEKAHATPPGSGRKVESEPKSKEEDEEDMVVALESDNGDAYRACKEKGWGEWFWREKMALALDRGRERENTVELKR
uniref:Uncharacterized protein n=1 Tax=Ananas comosus var. bracteatus TaxID=296719 RepID=A0A6V7NQ00_ANACO|nr:unnamed protein product [Ananas comosus var. bracteatus]